MSEITDFASHRRRLTDDIWYPLAANLRSASAEIQGADCPGNIEADIPSMVLTDITALMVEQWSGVEPEMKRDELLARLCGPLAYMLDWFKADAHDRERARLSAVTDALDALTVEAERPRFGKVPH